MEPFQGTDQQGLPIKGPGLFHAALKNRQHIFGAGRMIPIKRIQTGKFFLTGQYHA
jgi:hypothetical protein